jgi:hypothetical protein
MPQLALLRDEGGIAMAGRRSETGRVTISTEEDCFAFEDLCIDTICPDV